MNAQRFVVLKHHFIITWKQINQTTNPNTTTWSVVPILLANFTRSFILLNHLWVKLAGFPPPRMTRAGYRWGTRETEDWFKLWCCWQKEHTRHALRLRSVCKDIFTETKSTFLSAHGVQGKLHHNSDRVVSLSVWEIDGSDRVHSEDDTRKQNWTFVSNEVTCDSLTWQFVLQKGIYHKLECALPVHFVWTGGTSIWSAESCPLCPVHFLKKCRLLSSSF